MRWFRSIDAADETWRALGELPKPTFALLNIAESMAETEVKSGASGSTQILVDAFVAGTTNGVGQLCHAASYPKYLPRSMGNVPGSAVLFAL